MNTVRFITSMGPAGYKAYGEAFLEGWARKGKQPLRCYVEEDPCNYPASKHIDYMDMWEIPGLEHYLHCLHKRGLSSGQPWHHDLWKFSRKIFAQIDVLSQHAGKVFWIDSDIVIRKRVDVSKAVDLLDEYYTVYMGRSFPNGKYCHPCTSLVGWNTEHPDHAKFLGRYEGILARDIFQLPEWHDAYVYDHVRRETKVSSKSLSQGHPGSLRRYGNIFNDVCPWGRHMKGMKKYQ